MGEVVCRTKVGATIVPVVRAQFCSLVQFYSGEHGRKERGDFCFWTAMLKRGKGRRPRIIGRAAVYLPPGDRFDRMRRELMTAESAKTRAAYKRLWVKVLERGKNIKYIRPSTSLEVEIWCKGHETDARHIYRASIGGELLG